MEPSKIGFFDRRYPSNRRRTMHHPTYHRGFVSKEITRTHFMQWFEKRYKPHFFMAIVTCHSILVSPIFEQIQVILLIVYPIMSVWNPLSSQILSLRYLPMPVGPPWQSEPLTSGVHGSSWRNRAYIVEIQLLETLDFTRRPKVSILMASPKFSRCRPNRNKKVDGPEKDVLKILK